MSTGRFGTRLLPGGQRLLVGVLPAHGGGPALSAAAAYEVDPAQVSRRLVEHEVAAPPMPASGGTPTLAVRRPVRVPRRALHKHRGTWRTLIGRRRSAFPPDQPIGKRAPRP